jgi:tRNA A37 threonylcarbamoyladenosine modification protein TsaB
LQLPCANGVSLIDAKSEKTYICVYKENKKIVEEKIIKNSQINSYLNKFKSLKIYKNYEGINIFKNFIFWKQHYSDKHINPMYIKKII